MIAFLLANRTLAEFAGAGILILGLCLGWLHHDKAEQAIGEAKVTETKAAAAATALAIYNRYQSTEVAPAEATHANELASIPGRVITRPLWLRDGGEICADRVPSLPGAGTDSTPPPAGAVLPGPGRDIRPLLEAFRAKYETALADCRRVEAEWPR